MAAGQYSAWYTEHRWRQLRLRQLADEPLCSFCERDGRTTLATICDHVEPHKGDREKFWAGPFQSLCKRCHDSTKKSMERGGKQRWVIGQDGWPVMQGSGGQSLAGEDGQ